MNRVADMSLGPRLMGPMLIWLVVMIAGAAVAIYATGAVDPIGKIAVGLALPALLSLLLMPALHRTWSQVVLLSLWTGFAVMVTLIGGLFPIAITFLCIPAIAMLFTRERVVEALVLAALALIATLLSLTLMDFDGSPLAESAVGVLAVLGTAGTLALTVASMIAGTQARDGEARSVATTNDWADGLAGSVLKFDADGRMTAANADALDRFGIKDPRAVRLDTVLAGEPGNRLCETAELAGRTGRPSVVRVTASDEDGFSSLDLNVAPTDGGGVILHAIDRTEDAEQLETFRRLQTVAEREAAEKTLFFAGVSHELRTPLNAIIGFSDMMRSRLFGPLPGKYAEYADLIHDSGQYMLDLIGDVLDLSKVEAGKYTLVSDTFDMADVVRSSVKMIRPSADSAEVGIQIDVPEDDPLLVTADRKAMRQILLNLLSNAVKFSPRGGTIIIKARPEDGGMMLAVLDEGPGMSDADIARAGEPFSQGSSGQETEARGSGLGLSLVRILAELHGGRLVIRNRIEGGTDARIHVPPLMIDG
ncbi:HAMP domain-containing sensor histidine kinase [uncultured Algimonas sp.]|uniref:sensor histidine kinase n=1 Tax=uncultured Algimonas sp. TaxID=1547920 RepID=UPI002625EFCE|nr:HAMP domain-containing sensor histidine kinase [uncultured Algimonas sp.]